MGWMWGQRVRYLWPLAIKSLMLTFVPILKEILQNSSNVIRIHLGNISMFLPLITANTWSTFPGNVFLRPSQIHDVDDDVLDSQAGNILPPSLAVIKREHKNQSFRKLGTIKIKTYQQAISFLSVGHHGYVKQIQQLSIYRPKLVTLMMTYWRQQALFSGNN